MKTLCMAGGKGFFAYFIQALAFMHEFKNENVRIVINNKSSYYDKNIKWTDNVWEYYFNQASITSEDEEIYDNYFGSMMKKNNAIMVNNHDGAFFHIANKIFLREIEIKEKIIKLANDFYYKHMRGFKVLSMHKRNKYHYVTGLGHFIDQKNRFSLKNHIKYSLEKMKDYDKIFLLTDEKEAYNAFKDKYGNRLIHYDSYMTKSGDYILDNNNGYNLGEEVLIEVILASKTNHIIGGFSNIITAIRIFNNDINFDIIPTELKDDEI